MLNVRPANYRQSKSIQATLLSISAALDELKAQHVKAKPEPKKPGPRQATFVGVPTNIRKQTEQAFADKHNRFYADPAARTADSLAIARALASIGCYEVTLTNIKEAFSKLDEEEEKKSAVLVRQSHEGDKQWNRTV